MSVSVRPLREQELPEPDKIFRLAFGTFVRMPDPLAFGGDADYIRTRWRANPEGALAAESGGELVGSSFATQWGSFGFFGPLTVRPDLWDRGVAKRLLEPTMELFARWRTTHRGLFTFPHSPKHHALYQKFGFYPRFLTAVMEKAVKASAESRLSRFSALPENERDSSLRACGEITDALYPGLDLGQEIRAVFAQRLGDTLLVSDARDLTGFAVCHVGKGSEAGSGNCYVKFAAVPPGPEAQERFERLLDACESFAAAAGASQLVAGVNLAREQAYRALLQRGFHAGLVGVAMQSGNEPAYNRPDVLAIDDWR